MTQQPGVGSRAVEEIVAGLQIDWTRCEGRGICVELLTSRLINDPWGFPLEKEASEPSGASIPISHTELPDARQAVKFCPCSALSFASEPRLPGG